MVTYVYRDGQRLTPWMLYQINRLDADLHSVFGVHVIISSAIRTYEEQKAIFLERYVTAGNVRGRRVYDTRWWNGQLWYRISSAGTVATPGSSNHEVQGSRAAVDLRDTGSDAGLATWGSARSNWLRKNAHRYDLVPSGFNFGEAWHYDILNIFNTPPGGGEGSTPVHEEDEDMKIIRWAANGACWLMGDESTDYIATGTELATLEAIFGAKKTVNNAELTTVVAALKVPWAAMEATYRSQAFDNEANFGKGTSWTRRMAETMVENQFNAALAKSIGELEKAVDAAKTAS